MLNPSAFAMRMGVGLWINVLFWLHSNNFPGQAHKFGSAVLEKVIYGDFNEPNKNNRSNLFSFTLFVN